MSFILKLYLGLFFSWHDTLLMSIGIPCILLLDRLGGSIVLGVMASLTIPLFLFGSLGYINSIWGLIPITLTVIQMVMAVAWTLIKYDNFELSMFLLALVFFLLSVLHVRIVKAVCMLLESEELNHLKPEQLLWVRHPSTATWVYLWNSRGVCVYPYSVEENIDRVDNTQNIEAIASYIA